VIASKVRFNEERRTAGAKRQQYTAYSFDRQTIPRSLRSSQTARRLSNGGREEIDWGEAGDRVDTSPEHAAVWEQVMGVPAGTFGSRRNSYTCNIS